MTMESRLPEGTGSNSDLVRSAALSSADLWHEILERLNEVQEGQIRLARAIESLGMIVCDALSVNPQAALSGGDETTPLPRAQQRVPLAAGPPPSNVGQQLAATERDLAATQQTIDSLLSSDVFAPGTPESESKQAPSIPTPAVAATGSATSPRFYVAPVPEENHAETREPVSSGAWPRGRRVARGLGRDGPSLTGPSVVPNLTPAAIDALLAAEFGDAPSAAPAPRTQMVPAAEAGPLLNTLLGAEFNTTSSVPAPPTARLAPPHVGAPPPPPPPAPSVASATFPSTRSSTPAPPETPLYPPTPAPSMPAPPNAPPNVPLRSAPAMATAAPATPPAQPPTATPGPAPWSPTVDPRRTAPPATPSSTVPATPPPVPPLRPTAGPAPVLPPPVPASAHRPATAPIPPPVPPQPRLLGDPGPAVPNHLNEPATPAAVPEGSSPLRSPLGAVTGDPAPFAAPGVPMGGVPVTAAPDPANPVGWPTQLRVENQAQTAKATDSVAMASEILAVAPRVPLPEPVETGPTTLAEDVTIMAKGRRRRFRLR